MLAQAISDEYVDNTIRCLESWTSTFYTNAGRNHDIVAWKDAQSKLLQFQQLPDPLELCTRILEKSRNNLVLYQAAICLKNAIANEVRTFKIEQIQSLFEFLYEFLCARAIQNDSSINETISLTCAVILKRIAILGNCQSVSSQNNQAKEDDKVSKVIHSLCHNVTDPDKNLCVRLASALMLNSTLLECQMSNRSTALGVRVWKHLQARRMIEYHIKTITESALETINWAFSTNILSNPNLNDPNSRASYSLVATLIQCVEYCLSFNSAEVSIGSGGDRILRVIQSTSINMMSLTREGSDRLNSIKAWCELVMSQSVVQFLFTLYKTIKTMIDVVPDWCRDVIKSTMNCLYYLSDIQNTVVINKDAKFVQYVDNLMIGIADLMTTEIKGIDDSYQIASLLVSISLFTSDKEVLPKLNTDGFLKFVEASRDYTCKLLILVATTDKSDEEEEEERTVDALLDFWYNLFKNLEAEAKYAASFDPPRAPKLSSEVIKAQSRVIVERYISAHLHKPTGILECKIRDSNDLDFDNASENEDNVLYAQQLTGFGLISRIDTVHSAKILIELFKNKVLQLEALLNQYIPTMHSPDGLLDWENVNDDLHWLLLLTQHFITQTGYGEVGYMCEEILQASIQQEADVNKTVQALETCDVNCSEADLIVQLVVITMKLCRLEMSLCTNGKISWMSTQTNHSLTTFLSKFCLTYQYPKEQDYNVMSQTLDACFGEDSVTAQKFLKFVIEHTCCIILSVRSDTRMISTNVQLFLQIMRYHPLRKLLDDLSRESEIAKLFLSQMQPENLDGFAPEVAKSIMKLVARLFVEANDWNRLIDFFNRKWSFILTSIQTQQHQSELVSTKFLEFCDFCIGLCEISDENTAPTLLNELLVPIVKTLPQVMKAFANFDNTINSIFELLYNIVKYTMITINPHENVLITEFYTQSKEVVDVYSQIASKKVRKDDEESLEDIINLLQFLYEVMKRDWGNQFSSCEEVIKFAIEKLSSIFKPEFLHYPKIRLIYYRLLLYLVDEEDRLIALSDVLLKTIADCLLLSFSMQFEKEVENNVLTIISIVCRVIYQEHTFSLANTQPESELSKYMAPCLPALFESTIKRGSYKAGGEGNESIGPAFFALRCCYLDMYHALFQDLIEKQDDAATKDKIKSMFTQMESKVSNLTLTRAGCREFSTHFVPFLNELQRYISFK